MAETGQGMKYRIKCVSKEFDDLVERITEAFEKKHGIKPGYSQVTKMIADAMSKKNIMIT